MSKATTLVPSELIVEGITSVSVLSLGPDDALIFRCPYALSLESASRVRESIERWALDTFGRRVKCLILEDGASIQVLRQEAIQILCSEPAV